MLLENFLGAFCQSQKNTLVSFLLRHGYLTFRLNRRQSLLRLHFRALQTKGFFATTKPNSDPLVAVAALLPFVVEVSAVQVHSALDSFEADSFVYTFYLPVFLTTALARQPLHPYRPPHGPSCMLALLPLTQPLCESERFVTTLARFFQPILEDDRSAAFVVEQIEWLHHAYAGLLLSPCAADDIRI